MISGERGLGPCAVAAVAATACACALAASTPASAQDRTARLDPPSCEDLPFSHERLKDLLAVELSVHRIHLVDGDADDVVSYGPVRCGDASSPIRVVLERQGVVAARVRIAHEPPRALALYLAELMREPFDDPVADLLAGRATATELLPQTIHAGSQLSRPAPDRGARWRVTSRLDAAPPIATGRWPSLAEAPVVAVGVLAEMLFSPESQTVLAGPRLEASLRTPFYRYLRFSLDAGLATGSSDWGVHLGAASVGFRLSLAAGSRDFFVEVGPRLAAFYGWAVSVPDEQTWQEEDAMLLLGGAFRAVGRVSGNTSLVLSLEAGGPVAGSIAFGSTREREPRGGGIDDATFALRLGLLID